MWKILIFLPGTSYCARLTYRSLPVLRHTSDADWLVDKLVVGGVLDNNTLVGARASAASSTKYLQFSSTFTSVIPMKQLPRVSLDPTSQCVRLNFNS